MIVETKTVTTVDRYEGDGDVAAMLELSMNGYRNAGYTVTRSHSMRARFKAVNGDFTVEIELKSA